MGAFGGTPQASMSLLDVGNRVDLNCDDSVDGHDFAQLAGNWQIEAVLLPEDLNHDGLVDFSDVAILAENWVWQE